MDNTYLFIMDECMTSPITIWSESQAVITAWGKLLIRTGGTLKAAKCFYYMVDYDWQVNGS